LSRRAQALLVGLLVSMVATFVVSGGGWVAVAVEAAVITAMLVLERVALPVAQRWSRGAAGEEQVGQILDELQASGWYALHDVNLGGGNIDHVVIGPAGIFTIETKSHRGRINTRTLDRRMLKQAYPEAAVIQRITGLLAEPLLVFSHAFLMPKPVSRREGVLILPARMLAGHLQRRAGSIPAERVREVYERLAVALSV
jgi:hypothetical protein